MFQPVFRRAIHREQSASYDIVSFKMPINLPISHDLKKRQQYEMFCFAAPAKSYSPRMFANTNKAYIGLAKHSANNGMCVDPDRLVFTLL